MDQPKELDDLNQLQWTPDPEIVVRILDEPDAPAVFALTNKNRAYLRRWLPWIDSTLELADSVAFIRDSLVRYASHNGFACGIWYRGELAGTISLHKIDWRDRKVEIGYWLGESFQGKGIMTKACSTLISYAFERLRLHKVEIHCAIGNVRSRAIPERLGFAHEGIISQGEWLYDHFVDMVVYGMLAHEWIGRRDEA
jgi:ribosomal-protein-serine acetyltransferase